MDEKFGSQKDSSTEGFEPQSSDSKPNTLSVRLYGHITIKISIKNFNFGSSFDKKVKMEKDLPQRDSNPQSSD